MTKYLDLSHISPHGFKSILELFFSNNVFKFKDKYYIQTIGVPMSCICGPTVANIFLYILEMKWVYIYRPLLYKRYIDDSIVITDKEFDFEFFKSFFLNLKFTINTGDVVNFLDLNISYNSVTNSLKFSLYTKPTHVNKYLLPVSNHPPHIFKNIPISLFIRIRRICSDYSDFIGASIGLFIQLLQRGYANKQIVHAFHLVSNIERESLILYKNKNSINLDFSKNLFLFHKFNFNISKFNDFIFSSFTENKSKFSILNNFSLKVINRVEKNQICGT